MYYVGIDIAKDKHDCFITNDDGEVLIKPFTIKNNQEGYDELFLNINKTCKNLSSTKIGLEATGHYSYNILNFLMNKNLKTYVINPLSTNRFRKGLSLRNTKTDKVDSMVITTMLKAQPELKEYMPCNQKYDDLKSLARYRFTRVKERAKLKNSIARLVNILFPELETMFSKLDLISVLELLENYPGANYIANANEEELSNLIYKASKGYYDSSFCSELIAKAKESVGSIMPTKSLELKHTIRDIKRHNEEIKEIEKEIKKYVDEFDSPIMSIPGIGYDMGALIIGEIGDFSRFENADKLLAYAGMSPSTYQSGQLQNSHPRMEKHGSKYLRHALFNATKYVCQNEPNFNVYLSKKMSEGKHYYVALTHAAKKLVRLMYHLSVNNIKYNINH